MAKVLSSTSSYAPLSVTGDLDGLVEEGWHQTLVEYDIPDSSAEIFQMTPKDFSDRSGWPDWLLDAINGRWTLKEHIYPYGLNSVFCKKIDELPYAEISIHVPHEKTATTINQWDCLWWDGKSRIWLLRKELWDMIKQS